MRAVIQRVVSGGVTIAHTEVRRDIGRGAVVLVGVGADDGDDDIEYVVRKVFNTKLWERKDDDESRKPWSASVVDLGLDVLFVSQFTLHAELKGNKPSYHRASPPRLAKPMYEKFLRRAREEYSSRAGKIEDGEFGAMMEVHVVNDGPVTIIVDSKNRG
jgi:D-tyrosyl-tRNA(Tyr) deacylase